MKLKAAGKKLTRDLKTFGLIKTSREVLMEGINLFVDFRIVTAMTLETVNPKLLDSKEPLDWQFISPDKLFELAENPENQLTEEFLHTALSKGDECYGALDGDRLACYGWYASTPTNDGGVTVHFGSRYIYMYKGVTLPAYRGKRLHGIGMNRALREYLSRGYQGLISTVDAHNHASLQSCARLGYQNIGRVVVLKLGRRTLVHANRGCRERDFYLSGTEVAFAPMEPALTA